MIKQVSILKFHHLLLIIYRRSGSQGYTHLATRVCASASFFAQRKTCTVCSQKREVCIKSVFVAMNKAALLPRHDAFGTRFSAARRDCTRRTPSWREQTLPRRA